MAGERFQFESKPHGAGGFAKVIKGYDEFLERDIAVKVLDPLITKFEDEDRERFKREARILAKLSHTNIPSIYDVSFDDDHFLIIIEFIEGSNLASFLSEQGPCTPPQARRWFGQVASALHHAHENGVVHRDIKPSNIMLSPDLEAAHLVDFGIALSKEDGLKITKAGYVIGTPGYMSPEQEAGQTVDSLTDIYSLGVTLYEALAGQKVGVGQYKAISASNEAVPIGIDDLIEDCLLPKGQRIETAEEFGRRITGAFRLQRPLSEVLALGKLNELGLALEELNAETFSILPDGQKSLILAKLESIVDVDDDSLAYPGADLLDQMIIRGILLKPDDYRRIVTRAFVWAFDKVYPNEAQGRRAIQDRIAEACLEAKGETHAVLHEELEEFLQGIEFEEKPDWYLHNLRSIISALLANPAFSGDPSQISDNLREINRIQASRAQN